jgi:hypothetical protein
MFSFGALHGLSGLLAFSGNAKQAAMLSNRGHGESELETRGLVADSGNLLGMSLGQQSHGHPPALWCAGIIDNCRTQAIRQPVWFRLCRVRGLASLLYLRTVQFGLRGAEMERVSEVLQFPVVIERDGPFSLEPQPL